MASEVEKAERFSARRGKLATLYVALFVLYGSIWLGHADDTGRSAFLMGLYPLTWFLWGVSVLVLTFGPGRWRWTKRQRAILNDEGTRADQAVAARVGYAVALGGLASLFALVFFGSPDLRLGVTGVLTAAVAAPALAFSVRQRRG